MDGIGFRSRRNWLQFYRSRLRGLPGLGLVLGESAVMNEKTKDDYRKLAAHFYEQRLKGEQPSPKRITDALSACAHEYRPAYWRRLRNALEFDQRDKKFFDAADRIKFTRNKMTTTVDGTGIVNANDRGPTAPKQRRAKTISDEDMSTLKLAAHRSKSGSDVLAALNIAEYLGVRPAEMLSLRIDVDNGLAHVTGVKKSGKGDRGADRTIRLTVGRTSMRMLASIVEQLQASEKERPGVIHRVQSRLDRLTKRLWPRRAARPTLYSLRHKMGARLKASGADRRAIAYIMGHQSTKSVDVYGDRRSAKRSGGLSLQVGEQEAQAFQGRENHTAHPGAAVAPAAPVQQEETSEPSAPYTPSSEPASPGM